MKVRLKNYLKRDEITISDVLIPVVIPEKIHKDISNNLMGSMPTVWVSECQDNKKLQTGLALQRDSEGDIVGTGTIDGMIFNNSSENTLTENNNLKYLERAKPELAFKEGAYMWSNRLQARIGIDIDAVKWNETVDHEEKDNKRKVRKLWKI